MKNSLLNDDQLKLYYGMVGMDCRIEFYTIMVYTRLKISNRAKIEAFYGRIRNVTKVRKEQRFNRFWDIQQLIYFNPN